MKVLVADVGGTKTELSLVISDKSQCRVEAIARYQNSDFPGFEAVLKHYLSKYPATVAYAGFAVAGPVLRQQARLTNLPWHLSASALKSHFNFEFVTLINDLEGLAWSLTKLSDENFLVLQQGSEQPGNKAVIAAGTGLGEAILYCDDTHCYPFATEGGHCDFAAETTTDYSLNEYLNNAYGHVSWERIVSGQGLINIYRFLLQKNNLPDPEWLHDTSINDPAAVISGRALDESDKICIEALQLFVHYYGREAGNLALKANATGGLYIGGGIAEKILPALQTQAFIKAFCEKGRMTPLLQSIPVKIINDKHAIQKGIAACVAGRAKENQP
jgi:glucokinase